MINIVSYLEPTDTELLKEEIPRENNGYRQPQPQMKILDNAYLAPILP
jgi:hypothetical protein